VNWYNERQKQDCTFTNTGTSSATFFDNVCQGYAACFTYYQNCEAYSAVGINSTQLKWYKAIGVAVPSFLTYAVAGTIAWPFTMCMYVLDDVEQCSLGMIPNESGSFANSAFCKIDEELNPLGPGQCDAHD